MRVPFNTDNIIVILHYECLWVEERKFIVFESRLDKLLEHIRCPKEQCFEKRNYFDKAMVGRLLKVYGTCTKNHQILLWGSQPKIANFAASNVILALDIICSGSLFTTVKEIMALLHLHNFSKATYHKNTDSVILLSDGQCDSLGFSAKYYTILNNDGTSEFRIYY